MLPIAVHAAQENYDFLLKGERFTSSRSRQVECTPHYLLPFNIHQFDWSCIEEPRLTPTPSSTIRLQQTDPDLIRNTAKLCIQPFYRTNKCYCFCANICIIAHILRKYISQIFYFIFPFYTFNIHPTLYWTCIFYQNRCTPCFLSIESHTIFTSKTLGCVNVHLKTTYARAT